ncbi:HSP20-like chaperone [Cristinia sonorae]|uniref:HSP20-like chaperone n=1 Tax=Cristinia sonorae TaxID=1940300 RepID=A0A8K0UZ68_9AGAR|nr:HSP20-like chaperone [Cristinia sonorae]
MRCTNKGCGQDFEETNNSDQGCTYHPGAPVFHEGLKSWSCCKEVNKPVLEFDEFMKIPGCATGSHSSKVPQVDAPKPKESTNIKVTESKDGKEVYTTTPLVVATPPSIAGPREPAPPPEEEEDDLSVPVKVGTSCKRKGCGKSFVSDEVSRSGEGDEATCVYHPMPPLFREGSKGYLCCKRRVLEFDEFLKIEGCKKGRHLFAPKTKAAATEELTDCRIDHYQTPTEVHVSVFAKKTDTERSSVKIESNAIHLDLYLPANKRFRRSIDLFGPIDPDFSSVKFYGTKVELLLKKQDTRSWTILEKTDRDLGPISLTFGVGGRTGTIGAKEVILDDVNAGKLQR